MKLRKMIQAPKWRMIISGLFVCTIILLVGLINVSGYLHINDAQTRELEALGKINWQHNQIGQCLDLFENLGRKLDTAARKPGPLNGNSPEFLKIQMNYLLLLAKLNSLAEDPLIPQAERESLRDFSIRLSAYYKNQVSLLGAVQSPSKAGQTSSGSIIEVAEPSRNILEQIRTDIATNIATSQSSLEVRLTYKLLFFAVSSGFCLLVSFVIVVMYIADTRKREIDLSSALKTAKKAVKDHSSLVEHISYKIRTPLNTVSSSIELLKSTDLSKYQTDSLDMMESSMESITVIVSDILVSTAVEHGTLSLDPEIVPLNDILSSLYRSISPMAYTNNLTLSFNWPREQNLGIGVDPLRLKQVLHNLLTNAISYNESGSVDLSVESKEKPDNTVDMTFSVMASSIGLSHEQIEALNEDFSRPDQTMDARPLDMDLGLYISMAIVHSMEGTIRLHVEHGKGATFSITVNLPLLYSSRKSSQSIDENRAVLQPDRIEPRKGLSSVLVVDDIPVNRIMAERVLEQLGLRADQAEDGKAAFEAVQKKQYDLILMDIKMPVMDGFEATRLIRSLEMERQPVIIAVTAHVLDSSKERSIQMGMDAFIEKPFKLEDFFSTLGKFFDLDSVGRPIISLRNL